MTADISVKNGRNEAFTALTPAWWDSGKEYMTDRYLTSEEVWGEQGILDFEYAMRPVYDESGTAINGYFRTVRNDTNATIGVGMSSRYKIIQPREAFSWLDSLMQDGIMKYASAGVLKAGREIWILGLVPDDGGETLPGERHDKYILWRDRFDAGGSLLWFPCATRVECANTLSLALGECDTNLFKGLRHTGNMNGKLDVARQAIMDAKQAFAKYNADCRKLIGVAYTPDQAKEYVEKLFPTPDDDKSQRTRTIRDRKVQEVRTAFRDPSNNIGDTSGTFYQLVNSVSFAVDHGNVFAFRGKGIDRQDNRFISLLTGDGAKLKRKAFDLALAMAV